MGHTREGVTSSVSGVISALGAYMPPLVTRERFAELVGLPVGVITGFINKGYLPTVAIGKYSLVNVAAIQRSCVEKDFSL